jgi:selenobiotic family peptide radical SAM maturase
MHSTADLHQAFPACRAALGEPEWTRLTAAWEERGRPEIPALVAESQAARERPYLAELARLEAALAEVRGRAAEVPANVEALTANPTVELFEAGHTGLVQALSGDGAAEPRPGPELLLVWHDPVHGAPRAAQATDDKLLAIKLAMEGVDPVQAAQATGQDPAMIRAAVDRASRLGLVIRPATRIRREPGFCGDVLPELQENMASDVFTIQWHVTQACDLHCRHCYDRAERERMGLDKAARILNEFLEFCAKKNVRGQVSFTGGNPLMHPDLDELYAMAAERGFSVALLANPTSRARVERLMSIKQPEFFQVSLEGLEEHNDYIRGPGHYRRTMDFLDVLQDLGVYSMVMLTLTRANQDQVLPLAEVLKDRCDLYTFNRLSAVGEGASLAMAPVEGYREFLAEFLDAADTNPCIGIKDSLLNLVRQERGQPAFGGCAGHGCGAAFNFLAILPDGEVHACRKFPSKIGNVYEQGLLDIYDSPQARRYRLGSSACSACKLKPVCGGCAAVVSSLGHDPFTERDPYCFV